MKKKIITLIIICVLLILGVVSFIIINNVNNKDDAEGFKHQVIDEYVENDNGDKIFTRLYKPNVEGKVPIVIYSHGLGATYRAATDYAESLVKLGVATLSFDFRGGSSRSKSDGKTTDMSIITEVDDLEFLLSMVREWNFVDQDNIILMGSSQGGLVSSLVSARHNDIKTAVLLYPAMKLPEVMRNRYPNTNNIPESIRLNDNITVGKNYFIDIKELYPYEEVKKETKKILIIQGTSDTLVPVGQSRELNKLYKDSLLYEIEGAGHGFDGKDFDEAIKHIIDYFKDLNIIKKK